MPDNVIYATLDKHIQLTPNFFRVLNSAMHNSSPTTPIAVARSIRSLQKANGKHKVFTPIATALVPEHDIHPDDPQISELIKLINKLYVLSDKQNIEYQKHPYQFVNSPSIVGIRHNRKTPYRVVRIERYKEYSVFSSQLAKLGFKLCIFQHHLLDGIFIKGAHS